MNARTFTIQLKTRGNDHILDITDEIRRGTAQIWGSVNLTLKQAKARQTTDIPMLTAGPGEQEDCDVKIEGKDIVCLFCKGDSLSTSLKAVGTPGGGRYEWEIIGGEDRVALPPRRNRASVEVTGQKSSGNRICHPRSGRSLHPKLHQSLERRAVWSKSRDRKVQ